MLEDLIAELVDALNANNDILIDRAIRELRMVGLNMEAIAALSLAYIERASQNLQASE